MVFHIAVCAADPLLRARLQRYCMEYYSRRADACIVELVPDTEALLARDAAGSRYELYLIELAGAPAPAGLAAALELRRRGRREALAFLAQTPAYAYHAYRVDAIQYLLCPVRPELLYALLARAAQPEYGPALTLATAPGLRELPFAQIEYLECTYHVVHFHLTSGEDVPSLSQRAPFTTLAAPLLADGRFVQTHRSYLVNLAELRLLGAGEAQLASGARVPVPRGREGHVRQALTEWLAAHGPVKEQSSPEPPSSSKTGC